MRIGKHWSITFLGDFYGLDYMSYESPQGKKTIMILLGELLIVYLK